MPLKKNNIENIRIEVESRGYTLVSNYYKNAKSKLKFKCKDHGIFEMNWNNFKSGQKCRKCGGHSRDSIKNIVEGGGFTYVNHHKYDSRIFIKVICVNSHTSTIRLDSIQGEQGCKQCADESLSLSISEVESRILDIYGGTYTLLDISYKNQNQLLNLKCKFHGEFKKSFLNLNRSQGCPDCMEGVFKSESVCRGVIQNITGKAFPKMRPKWLKAPDTLYNLELDGYCEELGIAFEYDGIQHFEPIDFMGGEVAFKRRVILDKYKDDLCKKHNVHLIRIPYSIRNLEEFITYELTNNGQGDRVVLGRTKDNDEAKEGTKKDS